MESLKSMKIFVVNPLSAIPTTWSNTLKKFVGNLPTNCSSVFDHFVKLALKGQRALPTERSEGITQSKMTPEEHSCTIL